MTINYPKIATRWTNMMKRCYDERNPAYKHYGGRGIRVCERWHNFANFFADMGDIPSDLSMDRIDNDGNYDPDNIRLVDQMTQCNNRRNNHYLVFRGERKTIAEWSRETGISQATIHYRLKLGWSHEEALAEDVQKAPEVEGKTLRSISKEQGIPYGTMRYRIRRGDTPEAIVKKHEWKFYEHDGQMKSVTQLSKECGVSVQAITRRLAAGDTVEQAMRPVEKYFYQGKPMEMKDISQMVGIPRSTLYGRIKRGMTIEEAIAQG